MSKEPYGPRILGNEASRRHAIQAVYLADDGMEITIRKPKRSSAKSKLMWAILTQLEPIDWYGQNLTKDEWKIVITAALKKQKAVPGIDGGFVVLGEQTRNMPDTEIDLIILQAEALAGQKGIRIKRIENIEPQGYAR